MALRIEDISALDGVVQQSNFEIYLTAPPGGDGTAFTLKVNSTTMPSGITFEPIEIFEYGTRIKQAGRTINPGTWTVECREFENAGVISLLQAWRLIIHDPISGRRGKPLEYKTMAHLKLLKADLSTYKTATILGIWPESVEDITLDKATSDMIRIPITFAYDDVIYLS